MGKPVRVLGSLRWDPTSTSGPKLTLFYSRFSTCSFANSFDASRDSPSIGVNFA